MWRCFMANIIAVVWDFDKTLVDGYMQDPIFEEYNVDSKAFWKEVNALPQKYKDEQDVLVNPDTIYLNQFIKYAKEGKFKGLTNEKLKQFGSRLKFYKGIPEIFQKTKSLIEENPTYKEYNIKVEHYIVSTGMTQIIKGSSVMPFVEHVWGCELIEGKDNEGDTCISEIGYTIDNTSKTRALFEINKGVHSKDGREGVKVNTKIPEELRTKILRKFFQIWKRKPGRRLTCCLVLLYQRASSRLPVRLPSLTAVRCLQSRLLQLLVELLKKS